MGWERHLQQRAPYPWTSIVSSSWKADGQTGNAKLGADWAVVNKSFPIVNHQFNIFENRLLSVAPGETNIEMNSLVHAQKSAHDEDA